MKEICLASTFLKQHLTLSGALLHGFAGVIGASEKVADISTAILCRGSTNSGESRASAPEALRAAQQWVRKVTNGQLHSHYPDWFGRPERLLMGIESTIRKSLLLVFYGLLRLVTPR